MPDTLQAAVDVPEPEPEAETEAEEGAEAGAEAEAEAEVEVEEKEVEVGVDQQPEVVEKRSEVEDVDQEKEDVDQEMGLEREPVTLPEAGPESPDLFEVGSKRLVSEAKKGVLSRGLFEDSGDEEEEEEGDGLFSFAGSAKSNTAVG